MIYFLILISVLLILTVIISFVRNDFWLYKIFEYPRLQKLALIIGAMVGWRFYMPFQNTFHQVIFIGLVLSSIYILYKVWPYTSFAKKEMKRVSTSDRNNELTIFAANVLQDNRAYNRMLQQIKKMDADIVFLLETDKGWQQGMKELEQIYPFILHEPMDNTYGLLFYSKLKLENAKVQHLVKDDIPSVEAIVHLPSGNRLQLYGVHPEPPVPGENLYSTAKDKELMKVALKVKECTLPCIVFGDLNDVAWSHTTELFRKTSQLLDPRIGRGFYSTFSARHWFIRFPLDYIFCSPQFGLVRMKRMPKNGSDHFATYTHLALQPTLEKKQSAPEADTEELQEAKEIAHQPLKPQDM